MYNYKSQIGRLYTTFGECFGFGLIELLSFLANMKEFLDALGKSEGGPVRVLPYFIGDDAKDVYPVQISTGTRTQAIETTWPYVLNSSIRRLLTDYVLQ